MTGCTISGSGTDKIGAAAMLAGLANNGGPTLTHALLNGSAAIDSGDPVGCTDDKGQLLAEDQRGMPRFAGLRCDIGSYER
ncbi:MAG: hypothetical protein L0227_12930 [Chloroflexi bacterium]|nr:hypothetical protein [Chloroflexota bacterium]